MNKEITGFKQVNIAKRDWAVYNALAIRMSAERGQRVSIPALIKEAVDNLHKNSVDNVNN